MTGRTDRHTHTHAALYIRMWQTHFFNQKTYLFNFNFVMKLLNDISQCVLCRLKTLIKIWCFIESEPTNSPCSHDQSLRQHLWPPYSESTRARTSWIIYDLSIFMCIFIHLKNSSDLLTPSPQEHQTNWISYDFHFSLCIFIHPKNLCVRDKCGIFMSRVLTWFMAVSGIGELKQGNRSLVVPGFWRWLPKFAASKCSVCWTILG